MRPPLAAVVASGALAAGLLAATLASAGEPLTAVAAARPPSALSGDALVARGRSLFLSKGCVGCHTGPAGVGNMTVGPSLAALRDVAGTRKPGMPAEAYVRESIRSPQAFIVPGYECSNCLRMPDLGLTDAEIDAIATFLLAPR